MKNVKILSIFSFVLLMSSCQIYNRSSVTFLNSKATTEGKIIVKTDDTHTVMADKEQATSFAASSDGGTASAAEAKLNGKTKDDKPIEEASKKSSD